MIIKSIQIYRINNFYLSYQYMDLSDFRQSCTDRLIPIISVETENFLWNILKQNKPKVCLEIWSAVWYSSIFIANTIKERWWVLYSFEISYASYLEGIQNIWKYGLKNLIVYPFDFQKVNLNKIIPNTVDFAFIDWQKNQYANYLIKINNILSTKYTLVCDDVIKFKSKMVQLYEYLEKMQIFYEEFNMEKWDGIFVIKNY